MKPEEQRIAIAEACGWYWDKSHSPQRDRRRLISPAFDICIVWKDGELGGKVIPDYLSDLNAMHQAEGFLPHSKKKIYENCLGLYALGCFSTAAQRAEAFLRTIGKWVDSTPETQTTN